MEDSLKKEVEKHNDIIKCIATLNLLLKDSESNIIKFIKDTVNYRGLGMMHPHYHSDTPHILVENKTEMECITCNKKVTYIFGPKYTHINEFNHSLNLDTMDIICDILNFPRFIDWSKMKSQPYICNDTNIMIDWKLRIDKTDLLIEFRKYP